MKFFTIFIFLISNTIPCNNNQYVKISQHEKKFLYQFNLILFLLAKKHSPSFDALNTCKGHGASAIAKFGLVVQQVVPLIAPHAAVPVAVFTTVVNALGEFVAEDEEYQAFLEFKRSRGCRSDLCPDIDFKKDLIVSKLVSRSKEILSSQDPLDQATKKALVKIIQHAPRTLYKSVDFSYTPEQSDAFSLLLLNFFSRSYDLFTELMKKIENREQVI
ncbi:hypothetical protein FJ366_03970 [Candidatus Dependentiae bacterium]|nr:hypothetical protein [Candidatus Dependentiae bacterium]